MRKSQKGRDQVGKKRRNQQQSRIESFTTALRIAAVGIILTTTIMVSAPPAFAAGLKVTGGTITLIDGSTATFTLTGTFFTVTGTTYVPGGNLYVFCNPCVSPIYPFFGASDTDVLDGNGLVKSSSPPKVFPQLIWSSGSIGFNSGPSYFMITGSPITITGPGSYVSAVSYTLALCGINAFVGPPRCDVLLPTQSGTAYILLVIAKDANTGYLYTVSATYFF
jgi:hypothetical protein